MFSLLRFDDPDALSPDAGRSTSQCEGASIGSTVVHTNQTAWAAALRTTVKSP